jgi:hypothetical protein
LDFEQDVDHQYKWFQDLLVTEPPPDNIEAFWFGLFTQPLKNGKVICTLYVIGSPVFNMDDDTGDWACITNESYVPKGRFATSAILQEIYLLVTQGGKATKEVGEYVLCLGYACLTVKAICQTMNRKLLFGERASRFVAIGFDEGDFIIL